MSIGNIENKNWVLLAKWWWRFREQKEALRSKIIDHKYREEKRGLVANVGVESNGVEVLVILEALRIYSVSF